MSDEIQRASRFAFIGKISRLHSQPPHLNEPKGKPA